MRGIEFINSFALESGYLVRYQLSIMILTHTLSKITRIDKIISKSYLNSTSALVGTHKEQGYINIGNICMFETSVLQYQYCAEVTMQFLPLNLSHRKVRVQPKAPTRSPVSPETHACASRAQPASDIQSSMTSHVQSDLRRNNNIIYIYVFLYQPQQIHDESECCSGTISPKQRLILQVPMILRVA